MKEIIDDLSIYYDESANDEPTLIVARCFADGKMVVLNTISGEKAKNLYNVLLDN